MEIGWGVICRQDGSAGTKKKRARPFLNDGAERLDGKQHFIYANETAIPKTVQCVRIVKSRVGVVKLCIIAQHAPVNLNLILEIVLNYSTRRWTSSVKIKEHIYRSHLSRLETKNYLPFFIFKCFSKLVEIVGYLIATRGTVSLLIKYDRKRLS
jgi:hypothetical protein